MPTALVTGATAGIGAAFADALAARGYDLVLVARDEARLKAAAARLSAGGRSVDVLPADLADDAGCARVEERVAAGVDLLVNNAGLGTAGALHEVPIELEEHLLRVNVRAVLRLTHAALPAMLARGRGDIINVSSVAGFTPGARAATYSASKAWVTNFSESLHLHYGSSGIRVQALCPGFTRTEFHERAGMEVTSIPERLWLRATDVVQESLRDLERGRPICIPGASYKALVATTRLAPPSLTRRAVGRLQSRLPGRAG